MPLFSSYKMLWNIIEFSKLRILAYAFSIVIWILQGKMQTQPLDSLNLKEGTWQSPCDRLTCHNINNNRTLHRSIWETRKYWLCRSDEAISETIKYATGLICSLSSSTPRLRNKQFSSVSTVSTECSTINNNFTKYEHCQLWQLVCSIHCQLLALSTTTKNDSFIRVDYFWQLLLHCVTVCECWELFAAWGENTNRITATSCCNCMVCDI